MAARSDSTVLALGTAPKADPQQTASLTPFAFLCAGYFAHIGFFNPYLPLWLKDAGYPILVIGVLTSLQSATRLFAPYAWGAISDRTGRRVTLMRYSATVAVLASAGLWWAPPVSWGHWWLFAVLVVMFIHTSSLMPMSEAAMTHLVSSSGQFDASRYGRVRVWGSVGFLITVLGAGAWFEAFGMEDFPAWTTLTLLCVLGSVWWMPNLREDPKANTTGDPGVWAVLRQAPVAWFFASVFFHVLSHMGVYLFLSLYLDENGYSKTSIGLLWAVSVAVEIVFLYTQGRWLSRITLPAWLLVCAALCALRMGLIASSVSVVAVLFFAQALHGFTFATHHTACTALLSQHFPDQLRGRGQALYTVLGYGIPGVLAGLAGGAMTAQFGLASVFWACAITSLLALACAWAGAKARR